MSAAVHHVRLYIDQGAITWRLRVIATPDHPSVSFTDLPASFEDDTLRAEAWSIRGGQRQPLEVVEVSRKSSPSSAAGSRSPAEDERRRSVQAELDRLEATLAGLEDEEATDRFGQTRLDRYAAAAIRKVSLEWISDEPPVDRWLEVFDRVREQRIAWAEARQKRERQRQRLHIEKADRLAELQTLGDGTDAATDVVVSLAGPLSADDDEWEVELTALTPLAQWMPAYELRLAEAPGGQAVLTAVALVRQTTGHDWSNVTLVATTARPPLAEPPPSLRRLEVSGVPSDEDHTVISSNDEIARLSGVGTGAPSRSTVEHSTTATVPAHGRAVRVELFSVEVPAVRQLEVAPGQRTTVVEVAQIDNVSGTVLLPGRVSVFYGQHYAGQSEVGFVATGQRFVVPVRTDGRIRVQRRVHRSPPRQSSLTGAVTHDFSQTTIVDNLSSEALELVVRDRTPVSKSDGASIKLMERPADLTVDTEDGQTEVRLKLGAHARRQLDVAYRITTGRGVSFETPREL